MRSKPTNKKQTIKGADGKDGMGMRQTYKQTGEVEGIGSSNSKSVPRSNKNSKGGY